MFLITSLSQYIRIQTDWGTEFFADAFQSELMEHFIKFRPIKPRSPHLNGKVERSQKTDKMEFYKTIDLKNKEINLDAQLSEWVFFYNKKRPHSPLNGKTLWEKYLELEDKIPLQTDVTGWYWESSHSLMPRCSKYWQWIQSQKKELENFPE